MRKSVPTKDEHGDVIMTKRYVQALCEEEDQYSNPAFNTKLYLNSKAFGKIENLDEYTAVEGLWLQCNFIKKIEGISHMLQLKFLFLQNNMIRSMEGLESLSQLVRLDLSDNRIRKVECVSALHELKDLIMANNELSHTEDLVELRAVAGSLTFLNVSRNLIELDERLLPFLGEFVHLASLEFQGNPAVNQIRYYRKKLIGTLEQISYLDNKSISGSERRFAEAFVKGGQQAEDAERAKYTTEQQAKRNQEKESQRGYYMKVNERMKRAVAQMRAECQDEKIRALQRKEELTKRKTIFHNIGLENRRGCRERNELKLKKVVKDLARLYEQFGANLPENYPLSRYSYLVLSPDEYASSILKQENMVVTPTIRKPATMSVPPLTHQSSAPIPASPLSRSSFSTGEDAKAPEFVWNKSIEGEISRLLQKHAFDFAKVHQELVKLHPECGMTQGELQRKWAAVEMQRYRAKPQPGRKAVTTKPK